MLDNKKKIVILGAGVAGLRVAKNLQGRISNPKWEVILIDENEYHQYLYKIHEVCNLKYEEKDIIVPIDKLIDLDKITFKKMTVIDVDVEKNMIKTNLGDHEYHILVVALGSHPTYFRIEGLEENSLTLGSYNEAKQIRERIKDLFQEAKNKRQPPKIIIGGGGFSGVELAGELSEWLPILYKKHDLEQPEKFIMIIEALSRILPGWDENLVLKAQEHLGNKGVEFIFNDPITKVYGNKIELNSGLVLEPDLFIWTGGVRGDPACGMNFQIKSRRIVVDEYCRAVGFDNIFVAGDAACAVNHENQPQPPTAHIAMIQGDIVTNNILKKIKGQKMKKYVFNRAGEIVTLGKSNAIGDLFGFHFSGALATFMKKVVHWWYLHSIGGLKLLLE
jgi:NADH dehydrogenase